LSRIIFYKIILTDLIKLLTMEAQSCPPWLNFINNLSCPNGFSLSEASVSLPDNRDRGMKGKYEK